MMIMMIMSNDDYDQWWWWVMMMMMSYDDDDDDELWWWLHRSHMERLSRTAVDLDLMNHYKSIGLGIIDGWIGGMMDR